MKILCFWLRAKIKKPFKMKGYAYQNGRLILRDLVFFQLAVKCCKRYVE